MIDRILEIITTTAWFIFSGYTIVAFVRTVQKHGYVLALLNLFSARFVLPFLIVVSLNLISAALVFIEPQEVGVVISLFSDKGVRDRPQTSGLHWIIPLAEGVVRYPIYWQTYTMSGKPLEGEEIGNDTIVARTEDGQEVLLDCSVIFRIDAEQAVRMHIDWQERYIEDFVRPVTRGIVRSEVSQFGVDEVNSSERKALEGKLNDLLEEELEDKGLIMDQFVLRNITFSLEYAASVEQKEVAREKATQKQYEADQIRKLAEGKAAEVAILAKAEATAVVIKAKAEAEALEVVSRVLEQNSDLLTYEYIKKLSPAIRAMLVPNNAPLILPLPTLEDSESISLTVTPLPTATATPSVGQP